MKAGLLVLLSAIFLTACSGKDAGGDSHAPRQMLLNVSSSLGCGAWKSGDAVSILDEGGNHRFTASSSGETVMFFGEAAPQSTGRFAVNPYSDELTLEGDAVSIRVPATQRGFQAMSAAFSTNNSFKMQDICALLKFRLAVDEVRSVKIDGAEGLAGSIILSRSEAGTLKLETNPSSSSMTLLPILGERTMGRGEYALGCLPGADLYGAEVTVQAESTYKFLIDKKLTASAGMEYDLGVFGSEEILEDVIPDFSRVGYHWGDDAIPDVPVRITLEAPVDGSDARASIQAALDAVQSPGAVLLKAGRYNVSDVLEIKRSGVVLRGEGDESILYSTSVKQIPTLIKIGTDTSPVYGERSEIVSSYVAVGQMWVPVADPLMFAPGDVVFVYRPATDAWLDALHMREIAQNSSGTVAQWKAEDYGMYWERKVMAVQGNRVLLDNPIVMCIGGNGFGTGYLVKGSRERISECGIEYLSLDTRYDASKRKGSDYVDENHCWSAVTFAAAEHSWARGLSSRHFGYSCVSLDEGAKNISLKDCRSYSPVATIDGSRRYAFNMRHCQLCLIEDCCCDDDRHQFVTGARLSGPNVFPRCMAKKARNDAGPHQRWATGTLYDNVEVDGALNVQDRAGYGTGHGWTAVNFVLWNCTAKSICVQSPWATGQNWAVGCVGKKVAAARSYSDKLGPRPSGIWESEGVHVEPLSLYESQLKKRLDSGIRIFEP